MTRTLGAVLAGGRSRRFGSDKALAEYRGRPLIAHVLDALAAQCDAVVVVGKDWGPDWIADRPAPDMGPLGGLNAALHAAAARGFGVVMTAPCDVPYLSADLAQRLAAAGHTAFVADIPVIGRWPVELAAGLDVWVRAGSDLSVRGWARSAGAVALSLAESLPNLNTREDLAKLPPE